MEKIIDTFKRDVLSEFESKNKIFEELIVVKNGLIDDLQKKLHTQENTIDNLTSQVSELTYECKNYENVSIHKNLAKQISEKDNEIRILHNKLASFEKKYNLLNDKYDSVILEKESNKHNKSKIINIDNNVGVEGEPEPEVLEEDGGEDGEEEPEVLEEDGVEDGEEDGEEDGGEDGEEDGEEDSVEDGGEDGEEDGVEEDGEDGEEDGGEDGVEEEIEVDFYEKKLKPKNGKGRILFLITDDEQKDIYEKLEDGEPGEHIGRLVGKNNRPMFF